MQHRAERSLGDLVFEDAAAVVVGLAGVDHQRQSCRPRRGDMRAKAALLRLARAVLVEIIQPRLPQRHDLRMLGQLDQFAGGNAVFLIGLMRMGADRAIDVGKSLGDGQQPAEPPHPRRDGDDTTDPGGLGARDDGVEIIGKIRKVEMAMAVDEHGLQTAQSAFGST